MTQAPRKPSKKERLGKLLQLAADWQAQGFTPAEIAEKFTPAQYDFLVDNDIDVDALTLTDAQRQAAQSVKKVERPSGLTYRKKYPQQKMEVYAAVKDFLTTQGAIFSEKEKENYRDIDFTIDGTSYRIVLSNPRQKKS